MEYSINSIRGNNTPGLRPVSIAVSILWISGVWIVAHVVALTKDPEPVPTH